MAAAAPLTLALPPAAAAVPAADDDDEEDDDEEEGASNAGCEAVRVCVCCGIDTDIDREDELLVLSNAETLIELISSGTWSPLCLGRTSTPGEGSESSLPLLLLLPLPLLGRRRGGAFSFPAAAAAEEEEEEEEEEAEAFGRRIVTGTPGEGSNDPSSSSSSCPSLLAGARTT